MVSNFSPVISIIVAMDEKKGIGKGNALMWYIPEELKRFKEITMGHPIIMGRKTYESIGKPLSGRTTIVITKDTDFANHHHELVAGSYKIVPSLEEAIAYAESLDQEEIFIIGGGQIYQQALPIADKIYLTQVQGDFEADIFFPDYSDFKNILSQSKWQKSGEYRFRYLELSR